jgi:aminotransferase
MSQNERKRGTSILYELLAAAQRYPDTIFMARGDPDFDTPPHIIEAARAAMLRHANDYTPPDGLPELRQAIAERIQRVNGIDADPETDIVVTNGGQEALFLMVISTLGPGDELLTPEPSYNTYHDALRFAGGKKVSVMSRAEDNYYTDPDQIRQAITPNTRALLLVSPNNPGANVIPPEDVQRLLAIAEEHDLMVLGDDIYDMFLYDGRLHRSVAALPGGKERTLTLNATSKTYAMTGWRAGWIAGPADLMAEVKKIKAATTGATSVIAQYAALAALTGPQDAVQSMHQAYVRRRQLVMETLDYLEIPYGYPQGGQFVFADIRKTGMNSVELARRVLEEEHVLIYPGSGFGEEWDSHARITFLQPEEKLRKGMEGVRRSMERILKKI